MKTVFAWATALSAYAVLAFAGVPQTINYQGYLKNADGTPVSVATSVRFSLYSSNPARNNPVWHETKSITPSSGIYSTQLGSVTPINAPFDIPSWLGVKIAGDAEMALQELSSVPYALRAATVAAGAITATSIADATITPAKLDTAYVKLAGDTMAGSLNLPADGITVGTDQFVISGGKVGIGTGTPATALDLVGDFRVKNVGATYQYVYMGGGYNTRSPSCPCDSDPDTTDCVAFYSDTDLGLNCYDIFFDSSEGYGYLHFQRTLVSPLLVTSNGNIGIKTLTPATALDVVGTVNATSFSGNGAGLTNVNASTSNTVTNGVYTTGSYANPAWVTSLAGSKISGNISGNAANVTGTVAIANGGTGSTTKDFVDLTTSQTVGGNKTFSDAVTASGDIRINDNNTIYLRTAADTAHGLSFYGGSRLFGTSNPDGPVLFGASGGILGTTGWGHGQREVLSWDHTGNVQILGALSKGSGSFKIDHPLDPRNKYLYHSFVESPDMMNIYNGNVTTDDRGYAMIELPEWFDALNREFRYQLTVIDEADSGEFVQAKVVKGVSSNRFTVRTSIPATKVSWQVTGIRKDAFAEKNRIKVEEEKPVAEKGSCLHSEACID